VTSNLRLVTLITDNPQVNNVAWQNVPKHYRKQLFCTQIGPFEHGSEF